MTQNSDQFTAIIECLSESGALGDVIVIGSWAEWCYGKAGLLGGDFAPRIKTMDVDLLVPEVGGGSEKKNFVGLARGRGFLYDEDRTTGSSRLIGRDDFEVEFLTPQRGDGKRRLPRTSVGVNVQQLTHLDVLARFTTVAAVDGRGVRVPTPEAYALQKMVVNSRRRLKAAADREKIENILPYLDAGAFAAVYGSLTAKERGMADSFVAAYGFGSAPEAAGKALARSV